MPQPGILMISGDRALARGHKGAFFNTLEEFSKYWSRVDVICPRVAEVTPESLRPFPNVFLHPSPWPILWQSWWIVKKGRELTRRYQPAIVTVHEYPPFYNGMGTHALSHLMKISYVLEIHHIPGYPRAADVKEWLYRIVTRLVIAVDAFRARAVRVVNQQVRDFLHRSGVPARKLRIIPSFYIDLEVFKPQSLTRTYDLIFVGRLVENKGIFLLLETVRRLGASAVIVGQGPLQDRIQDYIKRYSLNIDLVGWVKDSAHVAALLNQSKVLIMPSYNEGGPRVVLEALACGLPVVATPVGIVPDLDKQCPMVHVIDWNPEDIAAQARKILSGYESYNRPEIINQFEKKSAIEKYAKALQQLI